MDSTDKNLIQFDKYGILKTNVPNILYHNLSPNSKTLFKKSNKEVHVNPESLITNVHVNPNFKSRIRAMHINPKMRTKPLIHVNPKMMCDIANSNQNLQNNARVTTETDNDSNTMRINIKRSIYVNPTLLKKLSSSKDEPQKPKELIATGQPTCLSATPVKNINTRKVIPKRTGDSRVVLLSRRKLVRIPRAANNTADTLTSQYKLHVNPAQQKSNSIFQRTAKVPLSSNNASQSTSMRMRYNLTKLDIGKSKVNKYKIDRTALNVLKVKGPLKTKKIRNNKVELVTIGGVVYKSSKNRLIRRSSLKRKRSISGNNDKPIVINNTKKLRNGRKTVNRTLETSISSKPRLISSISPKVTYKNNISNKVKQKSIQILRNKMRKNNQPCLIFQRFGYCLNHKKGLCPRQHDAKQVSICKKFLQGKCLLDKCPLSHDVGPEKMPTCKYFLDGCCTRDACPYLHVKVSSNTSICIDFLQGYCVKGNECQRRHEYQCPEFDKSKNCSKGKYCPYPHKSHSFNTEENTKYLSKITHDVHKHQSISGTNDDLEIFNTENRLRYYERTDNLSDVCDLEKKKENILRKIEIMKNIVNNDATTDPSKQAQINETTESLVKENNVSVIDITNNIKRRVPIGSLPAYIPIN